MMASKWVTVLVMTAATMAAACGGRSVAVDECGRNVSGFETRCIVTEPAPSPPTPAPVAPTEPPAPTPTPSPPTEPSQGWEPFSFSSARGFSACAGGDRYVRFDARYSKWVGVELCSATRYKIYLGETRSGAFEEIGDFAGHRQDHCELVNPTFKIPDEDDVTSGGCTSCKVEMAGWERPGDVPVYARSRFGDSFDHLASWPQYNLYTSKAYECGVSIP